ncbi:Hypothetical predicted protein [Mytilus galloprovincialis]|uniref:DNA 3'-5' helicase n=1 Tax=Mytilus galloprovincialis TaxID=29158 RepID=A0A8B6FHU4_MYTGA|nr:Hypothetical predicted protein [Mytilus galloprovincialis]
MSSDIRIVFATTALGMGFDVVACHIIILYGSPRSILDLVQEIGRLGRENSNSRNITAQLLSIKKCQQGSQDSLHNKYLQKTGYDEMTQNSRETVEGLVIGASFVREELSIYIEDVGMVTTSIELMRNIFPTNVFEEGINRRCTVNNGELTYNDGNDPTNTTVDDDDLPTANYIRPGFIIRTQILKLGTSSNANNNIVASAEVQKTASLYGKQAPMTFKNSEFVGRGGLRRRLYG